MAETTSAPDQRSRCRQVNVRPTHEPTGRSASCPGCAARSPGQPEQHQR
jgi:hypothetical protein